MPNPESENRPGTAPSTGAHSSSDEIRLLEFLDGQLAEAEARAAAEHLAACPVCQDLQREWMELDSELALNLTRPALGLDFDARLLDQIQKVAAPTTPARRVEMREKAEAEFQRRSAQFRSGFLRAQLPALLDIIGYGAAAGFAGYLLLHFAGSLGAHSKFMASMIERPSLSVSLAFTAILLAAGIACAAKRQLAGWLAEF